MYWYRQHSKLSVDWKSLECEDSTVPNYTAHTQGTEDQNQWGGHYFCLVHLSVYPILKGRSYLQNYTNYVVNCALKIVAHLCMHGLLCISGCIILLEWVAFSIPCICIYMQIQTVTDCLRRHFWSVKKIILHIWALKLVGTSIQGAFK